MVTDCLKIDKRRELIYKAISELGCNGSCGSTQYQQKGIRQILRHLIHNLIPRGTGTDTIPCNILDPVTTGAVRMRGVDGRQWVGLHHLPPF